MKREPGENPGRSGHCEWGAAFSMPLSRTERTACCEGKPAAGRLLVPDGKAKAQAMIHESGDLPKCGCALPSVERSGTNGVVLVS